MKKKSAVEYLELSLLGIVSFDSEELRAKYKEKIKQAKEMEKENKIKYNPKISDFNSDALRSKDIQRIGNVIFNKNGANDKDKVSWMRFKNYVFRLENELGLKGIFQPEGKGD